MINTNPIVRLKRSNVPGKKPQLSDLQLGELAVNFYDGKVFFKQDQGAVGVGTRIVEVGVGSSVGKTIFVTKNGNDNNTGLNEIDSKLSIKSAAAIAFRNDTIKVYPGNYVEDNPINLPDNVSIEGLELRQCLVSPQNTDQDLFYVGEGTHITDVSFVGPEMSNGAAVIAFRPLLGTASDRFFDGARMIRQNIEFISNEAVGFLTSGYSGFAGGHREQDAARLIDLNIDFIASEAVGYLTSTQYKSPAFVVPTGDPNDCRDDIIDILRSLTYDLRSTGNEKMVGAGLSYYPGGSLAHITGQDINGYDVDIATVETLEYAMGISTHIINNYPWGSIPSANITNITGFVYNNVTGISTVTSVGHGVTTGDIVRLENLTFSCPGGSGITTTIFPDGTQGFFFKVTNYLNSNNFTINSGISTIQHTYISGGTAEKYTNFQNNFNQVFDPSVIKSEIIYPNFGGCPGVANSIRHLVGIVTSIIGAGTTVFAPAIIRGVDLDTTVCARDVGYMLRAICHDITRGGNSKCVAIGKSYYDEEGNPLLTILNNSNPNEFQQTIATFDYTFNIIRSVVNNVSWGGISVGTATTVTNAVYSKTTGITTITAINHGLLLNDPVEVVGLGFTCPSGPGIVTYPSGNLGYIFNVRNVIGVNTFEVVVGQSTLPHTYVSGGTVQKYKTFQNKYTQVKDLSIQSDSISGFNNSINSCSNVISAIHSCIGIVTTIIGVGLNTSGITTNYPGNNGTINSGILTSSLSPLQGTGVIRKGPYIRNCTNFIANSIGARIDGFNADAGDKDEIGVQGSFNVDSYTQYNQGGIGVSITNGAYCQLVSIFTICNDIAVYTGSGAQCDLTNSNSSFGTQGLVSQGIGDYETKCTDRYTGNVLSTATVSQNQIVVSGVGNNRPYQGQSIYFDRLYFSVSEIVITNGGSGYTSQPNVTIDPPGGPGIAVPAQSVANVENGTVVSITIIGGGSQYITIPNIVISAPNIGVNTATAVVKVQPIYYGVEEATLPSAGITTISLVQNLNNEVGVGSTVFFARQSYQIVSSHSFEYIGTGNTIETAYPSRGGVTIQENEIIKLDGGDIAYTSTDQQGNFRIGDGLIINQQTGSISGPDYVRSLFTQVTPFILALGGD